MSTDDLNIINTRKLAKALAVGIESRGPHATGVAFRTPSGSSPIQIHKAPVCATQFIKRMPMPRSAQVGLVHTRYATQGDPSNNKNNHPIANGGIVGVHNGHVTNDDHLFRMVKEVGGERYGEVDSEAIFAAIAYNVATWVPKHRRDATLSDVLESVRGGAAIAWLDESDPDDVLHISRLSSSPLVMSWTPGGSLIFASDLASIKEAAAAVGVDIQNTVYLLEGTKYTIKAGGITNKLDFTPPYRSFSSGYTSVRGGWSSLDDDDWGDSPSILRPRPIPLPAVGRMTAEEEGTEPVRTLGQVIQDISVKEMEEALVDDLTSPLSLARVFGSNHFERYRQREKAIDKFRDSFTTTPGTDKAALLAKFHAFVRVGTWVKTTLSGYETTGQVYAMPDTFPRGTYVLRVLAYNGDRDHDEEWVLVARKATEFEVHDNQDLKSNGDLDAAETRSAKLNSQGDSEFSEYAGNVVLTEEDKAIILAQEAEEEEANTMSTSEDGDLEVAMDWALEKEESKSLQEIDR